MVTKTTPIKYDIICGNGQHRSYTSCIAELMCLNKYGNLPDYFWHDSQYYDEYVKLIKLAGKLSKEVGRDRLAFFLYKSPGFNFNTDIGLVVYSLRNFTVVNLEFTLTELVEVYKNKFRPTQQAIDIPLKQIATPKQNKTTRDFLGDI